MDSKTRITLQSWTRHHSHRLGILVKQYPQEKIEAFQWSVKNIYSSEIYRETFALQKQEIRYQTLYAHLAPAWNNASILVRLRLHTHVIILIQHLRYRLINNPPNK